MRIERISIKNLFGIFNHTIDMNRRDRITIIHGPNGFGKTVLLTLIYELFSSQIKTLRNTPFSEFRIYFDNGSYISITKNIASGTFASRKKSDSMDLTFSFYERKKRKPKSWVKKPLAHRRLRFPLSIIERRIPELKRIGLETWQISSTKEILSLEDVIYRFARFLPVDTIPEEEPEWLSNVRESIPVRLTKAQRLLTSTAAHSEREYRREPTYVHAVTKYSNEITDAIQAELAEYARISQSLDRSFPRRLLDTKLKKVIKESELRERLAALEKRRSSIIEAGLLKEEAMAFKAPAKIKKADRKVLSVYADDVEKKLAALKNITNKIELLRKIINKRFLYKSVTISPDVGFLFKTQKERILSPINLSSGEQHELVLLYEMLFKVKPNSLILIDEPELSLHVIWQQEFLRDLIEVINLSDFDALIATHSPEIIHDRWDLTVELKGPNNESNADT